MDARQPTLATHKIVIFVVFICTAIMTSLFVFHLNHPNKITNLPDDAGVLFPVGRDIKSFELQTSDDTKFSLADFRGHWTLLFFGFTHCSNVCPTTLDLLNKTYSQIQQQIPSLQVVLVSLDPERDTPQVVTNYARSFNPAFIGVTGKIQDLRKLQSQLGIYANRDNAPADTNYQIEHTSSILLINPKGQWAGMYRFGIKPEQLAKAIQESVKILG